MRAVGIREMKNKLSEYLRIVAEGETVLVTDRGRVVAQLAPPPAHAPPAISEDEASRRTGVTVTELQDRSFLKILENRRR